jgi:hypothetical protein
MVLFALACKLVLLLALGLVSGLKLGLFLEECLEAYLFLGQLLFHAGDFERVGIWLLGTK